ncbi:MAG: DUF1800 domain-containing protein [Dehalococcoidia bacterium]|nr:DUF1800 domain-containing protein [Dehalococcoidia bacterium]
MPGVNDLALMSHLMRRAGFGAGREELEARAAKGYAATVEELLHPEQQPPFDDDLAYRYIPYFRTGTGIQGYQCYWMHRMISTKRPLEEKMALFWHSVFATGFSKVENAPQMNRQLQMLRQYGMGNFRTLLVEMSRDPAMIFWLDNCENHKGAPNENWGRELLELFTMGVGMDGQANYSEDDVKVAARAFTGWTMTTGLPRYPYGEHFNTFEYRPGDHDDDEKTFLGEQGRFNGEDVVDIICKQPATARFISRHLYNFFVADEPQVPAWQNTPPRDPAAIRILEQAYFDSHYDIRAMLWALFSSEFFKASNVRYAKVKSPAELVAGVMRLAGDYTSAKPYIHTISASCNYMGQELLNPPTVEGWHTGKEWIDSGALVERVNFAADQVGDLAKPGVRRMAERLAAWGPALTAAHLVDRCLELIGPVRVPPSRRAELITYVEHGGPVRCGNQAERQAFDQRVARLLQLIVAAPEFQLN